MLGRNALSFTSAKTRFQRLERALAALPDVGFVNAGSYSFGTSNYNSDYGIGLRLDLPIGPVRIDYGIPIKADQFNDSSGRFNFNIGYQF